MARNTVNLATFLAARQGAVAHADRDAMRRELARGLLPLYVPAARDGRAPPALVARSYATALRDVLVLDELRIEAPTRAQAAGLMQARDGVKIIPNDALEYRGRSYPGGQRADNRRHALSAAGGALHRAGAGRIADGLRWRCAHQRCYATGRAPLRTRASVVMQSDTLVAMLPELTC